MILCIKNILIICLNIIFIQSSIGQLSNGVITYERKTNLLKKYKKEDTRKWLDGKKIKIDEFKLYFNPTQSLFIPVQVAEEGRMSWATFKNTVYQDLENEQRLSLYSLFGEAIYVKDSLILREWKITDRKRKISGYDCRRAIWQKNDSTKIYAWYTDEILPSCGPETFNGLPGTILGLATEDGGVVYFAKSVKAQSNNINEMIPDTKKKDVLTEQELRIQLEKRAKNSPWMKNIVNEIFFW